MLEPDGSPNTAHSLNPVPVIVTVEGVTLRDGGVLADVAPTVLELLGVEQPEAMTGRSLIARAGSAVAADDADDRLYGLPLDAFVAERDALAKRLRADGRREEATGSRRCASRASRPGRSTRPSARSRSRRATLWKAGDALIAAQDDAPGRPGDRGEAARPRSRTSAPRVDALARRRPRTAHRGGRDLAEATIERVRETLHAGAIDPDAREEVAGGRSARERAPQGLFGGGADVFAVEAPARAAKGQAKAKAAPRAPAGPKGDDAAARGRRGEEVAERRREEVAERKREEAAARKREREQAAARERELKGAAERVAKAQRALAQAQERSAKAAERLDQERAKEREADEALAAARADLRTLERGAGIR